MNTRQFKHILAATVLVGGFGSVTAHAEQTNFYAGANLGAPGYPHNVNGVDGSGGDGLSGKVFGGYQFTPNFAVETGLVHLGRVENANGSVHARGEFVDAVGIAPLNDQWSLLGRLGVTHVTLDTSNGNDNGSGLKVGLGAQYALTKTVALRGEWERYRTDAFGSNPSINQYTFGVRVGI